MRWVQVVWRDKARIGSSSHKSPQIRTIGAQVLPETSTGSVPAPPEGSPDDCDLHGLRTRITFAKRTPLSKVHSRIACGSRLPCPSRRPAPGSFRPMPLASGRPRPGRTMRHAAGALLRSLPLPGRPVPRSAQSLAERATRHAAEFAGPLDECREGDTSWWRGRLACAMTAARQEPSADVQHTARRPGLRRGGQAATSGREPRSA